MSKTITIRQLFNILNDELGLQKWWPADSTEEMLTGMVLIQNTNWKNVDPALDKLREKTNFELDKMLALSDDELKDLIRSSGFFNSKSVYLRTLLTAYRDNFDDWEKLSTKELRKNLTALTGIGNETADVLMLYYFHRSTFVADNYAMRLFKTMHAFEKKPSYMKLKNSVEQDFDFTPKEAGEFHAAIDEFGKLKSDFFEDYQLVLPEKVD